MTVCPPLLVSVPLYICCPGITMNSVIPSFTLRLDDKLYGHPTDRSSQMRTLN